MNDTLRIAQEASSQSDRTLFIAVIMSLSIAGMYMMWMFIRDLKDTRTKHLDALIGMSRDMNQTTKDVSSVVAANTEVVRNCNEELRHCRDARK